MSICMGAASRRRCCSWSRAAGRVKNSLGPSLVARCKRTYANGPPHAVTPLGKILSDSIKATGPISVAEYTQLCLSHPTEGYYMKERGDGADVFGAQGDFTTSPEISQVFGELVGIWLLSQWLHPVASGDALRKNKIRLVELGPGRGTLMDDILRTFFTWPLARVSLSGVHLVETSPPMRSKQKEKLAHWFQNSPTCQLHTYASTDSVPEASDDEFTMVVAHEFFDALPAHILEKTSDGFREVLVDLHHPGANTEISSTASKPSSPFRFVLSPTTTPRSNILGALSPRFAQLPLGARLEVSKEGWLTARVVGKLVSKLILDDHSESHVNSNDQMNGVNGAGLIIDYGDDRVFGSSFRAFKKHRLVDVFETPGLSDLTTNVDFALLKESCKGIARTHGPLAQSEFLIRMGIRERLDALMKEAPNEDRRREIANSGRRLIDKSGQGMGAVYRVLGLTSLPARDGPKDKVWPFVDEPSRDAKSGVE